MHRAKSSIRRVGFSKNSPGAALFGRSHQTRRPNKSHPSRPRTISKARRVYSLLRTVEPTSEPVSLTAAKRHCRIDTVDSDSVLRGLIVAAREWCENRLGQQFMPATWRMKLDCFPCWELELPRPPLVAVSSITYLDAAGTSQTLSSTKYRVDTDSRPGRITPNYANIWPITYPVMQAVTVAYTAGYADSDSVPQSIKQAMLLLIGHWYENREGTLIGSISKECEFAVESLLMSQWHGGCSLAGVN